MKALLTALLFILVGCTTSTIGSDPKGEELKAKAAGVLDALIAYEKDHGAWPTAFSQLVPKYIPARPTAPELRFNEFSGDVGFRYMPPGATKEVECVADFGDTAWECHERT